MTPTDFHTEHASARYSEIPTPAATTMPPEENSIDLLALGVLLARRKRFILLSGIILATITAIVTLVMPPTYIAQVDIMPPKKSSSPLSQLGALSALAGGGASALGLKNPDDLYIGMLQSQTIADELIQRFHLESIYKANKLAYARKDLAGNTKIISTKSGFISISVQDHNPVRAAAIANAYVDALHHMMSHLAVTEAGQRRIFFEQQLEQEKNKLADAEVAMAETERKVGIIAPAGQAMAAIESITQLQAQIAGAQVQLQGLEASATPENPEVILLKTQIAGLQSQLAAMEKGSPHGTGAQGNFEIPTSKVPEASLEYIRRKRAVSYHETLFELLARQYEIAKVDEAKAGEIIQVVDPALVPELKSWPPRTLLTLLAGFLGVLFASFWVILQSAYLQWTTDPETAPKIQELRAALRFRR